MGRRALVVTGVDRPPRDRRRSASASAGEPTVDDIRRGAELARSEGCDVVVAIGGGSAIDAGQGDRGHARESRRSARLSGSRRPRTCRSRTPPSPFIAVPTTAGTGSEVTRNAVLASPEHRVKASLRSAGMLPRLAVIDPELTYDLPPAITASTGLDALAQVIEPYVSVRANPMTDLFCAEGIRRIAIALPRAYENGADREARVGHVLGQPAGRPLAGQRRARRGARLRRAGRRHVPCPARRGLRGAAAARRRDQCRGAARPRARTATRCARYDTIARLLTGQPHATADDAVWWLTEICARLEIPPLRAYGVEDEHIPDLVAKAAKASSMKGNPIELTAEELTEIVSRAR